MVAPSDSDVPIEETEVYTQHVETPMNACSLETLAFPVETQTGGRVWPMMLGCYELDESTGHRMGHLDLYAVPVPTIDGNDDDPPQVSTFGSKRTVFGKGAAEASGILDGKFAPSSSTSEAPILYATAHATGEIQIHHVSEIASDDVCPLQAETIGQSAQTDEGLCLALSWGLSTKEESSSSAPRKMISSYSNGRVAIHELGIKDQESSLTAELSEIVSWDAHKMFHSPAEVWCASFTTHDQVVLTGGDEGQLKIWDLRVGTIQPVHTLKHFEAGVTVLSPHPTQDHILATGSYDETIAILDLRTVSETKPKPLCHSEALGGGMWRMKWHPLQTNRLLLGAMHGGCRVVDVDNLEDLSKSTHLNVRQSFTKHKSMAYGADWLVYKDLSRGQLVQAAASCSFYDRAMYLWNVKP